MLESTPTKPAVSIPDYDLLRPIGRGSYGEVWLGQSVLGEYRAVKVVSHAGPAEKPPWQRELDGLQKYEPISRSHEGLVHILHVGRLATGFYYVMELADDAAVDGALARSERAPNQAPVAGSGDDNSSRGAQGYSPAISPSSYAPRTLRREIQNRGRLPVRECIEIGLKLTGALAHLHAQGLVHRDVKPSNIIFTGGSPKLADIGLVTSSDASLSCVGTEGFLPPEGPGRPQADLFALGKVLYEICTGRDRTDFPELPTLWREDPERRSLDEFNEVILKACDPDLRQRYATARDMGANLELLEAGKSLQQVRRRQRRWASLPKIVLIAVLAVGLAGLLASRPRKPHAAPRKLSVPLAVDGGAFWREWHMARQFDVLSTGERIVFTGTNDITLWDRATSITRRLELHGTGDWKAAGGVGIFGMPRWAPNGRQFIFQAVRQVGGTKDNPIREFAFFLADGDSGQAQLIGQASNERANDSCWHPSGEAIVYASTNGLMTLSLKGDRIKWRSSQIQLPSNIRFGGYSTDGKRLLISTDASTGLNRERDICWIPDLGGPGVPLITRPGNDTFPVWGPGDDVVFFVSTDGQRGNPTWGIWKISLDRQTGKPIGSASEVLSRRGHKLYHPKFIRNGQALIYVVEQPKTRIWSSPARDLDRANLGLGTEAVQGQDPILSPDGQTIYFVGEAPEQKGVFSLNQHANPPRLQQVTPLVPLGTGLTSSGLSLAPDGERLALFAYHPDQKQLGIYIVPVGGGPPFLLEKPASREPTLPVWSPQGDWIAFVSGQQLVRISPDGRQREVVGTEGQWHPWSVRWSPDGKYIAALGNTSSDPALADTTCAVYLVNLEDKTVKTITTPAEGQWKEGLEWHPTSQFLTYMIYGPETFSAQIRRAYPDGRPTELMIDQSDHWDYLGVWAPDGHQFFFNSSTSSPGEKAIHLFDSETAQITHELWDGGLSALPRWSRDGRTAVWAKSRLVRQFEVIESLGR